MPPPSPVPGWARGDVWRERTASRRMAPRAYRRPGKSLRPGLRGMLGRLGGGGMLGGTGGVDRDGRHRGPGVVCRRRCDRGLLNPLVLVLAPEGEVDPHEGL